MNTPSHEALKLAERMIRGVHGSSWYLSSPENLAAIIDRELQLPQRNAALLCAQAVIDAMEGNRPSDDDAIDQLREALENIKTTP